MKLNKLFHSVFPPLFTISQYFFIESNVGDDIDLNIMLTGQPSISRKRNVIVGK